jgi:hypothetical protein
MRADTPLGFVLVALALWRLTHLFAFEDGPWRLFARARESLQPDGFLAALFNCFYCLSLWLAFPFAWATTDHDWGTRLIVWLALSGAACVLEGLGQTATPPALFYEGDKEEDHELLRRTAQRNEPPGRH